MTMPRLFPSWTLQLSLPIFLLLLGTSLALEYNQTNCCIAAQDQSAFVIPIHGTLTCGQSYDASKTAAPNAYVSYTFCRRNCGGIGLSQAKKPGQWAAPLVQFILPSIIFSMTIPRMKQMDFDFVGSHIPWDFSGNRYLKWLHFSTPFLMQLWAVVLLFMDTTIWIGTIIICAAPMMVSGLYESLLDNRVLSWLGREELQQGRMGYSLQFLVVVVCGNLRLPDYDLRAVTDSIGTPLTAYDDTDPARLPELEPLRELTDELQRAAQDQRLGKLRHIMDSQMNFGSIVGAPVLFYLGAFVYTILDLLNDPSDQDAAISLAFGVEWMIIPHVAIVAGGLLASNNPSTAAAIVGKAATETPKKWYIKWSGWGNTYEGSYQPVSMRSRGENKMRWIKSCTAWNNINECGQHFDIQCWQWMLFILLPTFILISLPALAGAFVAYGTPPIGWGCRYLTFMVYAASQIMLAFITVIESNIEHKLDRRSRLARSRLGYKLSLVLKAFLMGFSFISAVAGTLMQIIGVFRNCICYVNASSWTPHLSQGRIDVASDTKEQRNSSSNWIIMGSVATGFMAICCYIGWWYTRHIRQRFWEEVSRERVVLESSDAARNEETRTDFQGTSQSSTAQLVDHGNGVGSG